MTEQKLDRHEELSAFVRGTSTRAVAQLVWKGAGFASAVTIVRILPEKAAGSYFFVLSTGALCAVLLGLGFFQLLGRQGPRWDLSGNRDVTDRLFTSGAVVIVAGGLLLGAVILLLSPNLAWFSVAVLAVAIAYQTLASSFFRVRGRPILAEMNHAVTPVAFLVLLLLGALVFERLDAASAITLRLSLEVGLAVTMAFLALRGTKRANTEARWREFTTSSLSLWFTGIAWIAIEHADVFLLGMLRGAGDVGIYVPSLRIAELAAVPFGMLLPYLIVTAVRLASNGNADDVQRLYTSVNKIGITIAAPLVTLLAVAPAATLDAIFGLKDANAAHALRILSIAFLGHSLLGGTSALAEALLPLRYLTLRSLVTIGVTVVATLILIDLFGIIGAALGTSVGYLTVLSINVMLLRRESGLIGIQHDALVTFLVPLTAVVLSTALPGDPGIAVGMGCALGVGALTAGTGWFTASSSERSAFRRIAMSIRSGTTI